MILCRPGHRNAAWAMEPRHCATDQLPDSEAPAIVPGGCCSSAQKRQVLRGAHSDGSRCGCCWARGRGCARSGSDDAEVATTPDKVSPVPEFGLVTRVQVVPFQRRISV
jgi:hypothetical protein